jgi:hypothetical protein
VHHSDGAIFVCEHVREAVSGERFRTNPSISTFPSSPIYICQIKRRCLLQHRRGIILEEARLYSSNPHLLYVRSCSFAFVFVFPSSFP